MSFIPLPKTFIDLCLGADSPSLRILELGCGDGRFAEVLSARGIRTWGLDLVGPRDGTAAHVVGDALFPPVAPGSLDILLAPNLLRHLAVRDRTLGFLSCWRELLKPGGSLFVFEDEPGDFSAAVAGYRELQEFLCRLMPESRGPLLSLADFRDRVRGLGSPGDWDSGLVRNKQAIDAGAVLDMLGDDGKADGRLGRLLATVREYGLDPGYYWWARVPAAVEGAGI